MTIALSRSFLKAYTKRIRDNDKLDRQYTRRVDLYKTNPANPVLNDHPLKGNKFGLRAFSVTGDVRIIYRRNSENEVEFLDIGTHAQVY